MTPVCDLISKWGYDVQCVTSEKEALGAIKEKDFDIFIVDLRLGETNGIELIKIAKKIAPLLVCIVITGQGTIQTAVEAIKEGAFDYISKPVDWKMLKMLLSRAMEMRLLKKSEEKYRAIVEHQTELICSWKPDWTITYVNEVFCHYFEKTSQELIGSTFPVSISEEDHERLKSQIDSLNPKNPVTKVEYPIIMASGEIRWQQWINQAIFDEQGSISEFHSVGRDITELKHAEEQLKNLLNTITKAKQEWEMTFDSVKEFIVIIDKDLDIIRCNKGYAKFLGIPVQELVGRRLYDFTPFYTTKQAGHLKICTEDKEPLTKHEIKTETGEWFYISHRPVRNIKGEIQYCVIVMTDITDLKNTQQKLLDSERNLKERVRELEEFYNMSVSRELKMIELKEEVERLKKKLEKYEKSE